MYTATYLFQLQSQTASLFDINKFLGWLFLLDYVFPMLLIMFKASQQPQTKHKFPLKQQNIILANLAEP